MITHLPQPDRAAIRDALAALFEPEDVIELRAFPKGKKRTEAGYFDGEHWETLADAAVRLNKQGASVYVTLNRIDPQLLGRYNNRIENFASATVTDANVIRRHWLLVDFDPVRPKETSATDAQLAAAKEQAQICRRVLSAENWPEPLVAESGNGYHLLYPIDLPNDAQSRDLVKGALAGLAQRFDTEAVTVDQAVFNAGRITKLYGTVATKGDHTQLTPWRVSRLNEAPGRDVIVSPEQLRALCPIVGSSTTNPRYLPGNTKSEAQPSSHLQRAGFNLPDFLVRLGIPYEQDQHEGCDRYKLVHCPFDPEHGKGDAAIFQRSNGVLGFKCLHNACADKRWQDVRALVDGARETGVWSDNSTNNWPEPKPIRASLHPIPPFDPHVLLPDALRDWVVDEADRMPCPPDFIAAAALVALGAVIGARCAIHPKSQDDWLVIPNLWGSIVAPPSAKKSLAINAALKPYERLIARAMETHQAQMEQFKDEKLVFDAKKDAIESRIKAAAKDPKKGDMGSIVEELKNHRR
uniref:DUF3987 domain-containing protein n=1 Tax=Candidatus Kentrum sp. FW TaxID=2126338 RepID=A0A450T0C6_9GAMM|nr:MAG: Protein of unknown function (DUF3987) [Candidatus Kentron sp. FW]